jgi:hypothetical protein
MIERPASHASSFGRRSSSITAPQPSQVVSHVAADLVEKLDQRTRTYAERPRDLDWFDRLQMVAVAISLIHIFIALPFLRDLTEGDDSFAKFGLSIFDLFAWLVASFLFMIGLWFFASRMRSNIARWILTLVYVQTGWSNISQLITPTQSSVVLPLSIRILTGFGAVVGLAVVYFLFTPAARAWFARR